MYIYALYMNSSNAFELIACKLLNYCTCSGIPHLYLPSLPPAWHSQPHCDYVHGQHQHYQRWTTQSHHHTHALTVSVSAYLVCKLYYCTVYYYYSGLCSGK